MHFRVVLASHQVNATFVVKNPLTNSPLYNYSLFGVILLNHVQHAILKGLTTQSVWHGACAAACCQETMSNMCPITPQVERKIND